MNIYLNVVSGYAFVSWFQFFSGVLVVKELTLHFKLSMQLTPYVWVFSLSRSSSLASTSIWQHCRHSIRSCGSFFSFSLSDSFFVIHFTFHSKHKSVYNKEETIWRGSCIFRLQIFHLFASLLHCLFVLAAWSAIWLSNISTTLWLLDNFWEPFWVDKVNGSIKIFAHTCHLVQTYAYTFAVPTAMVWNWFILQTLLCSITDSTSALRNWNLNVEQRIVATCSIVAWPHALQRTVFLLPPLNKSIDDAPNSCVRRLLVAST